MIARRPSRLAALLLLAGLAFSAPAHAAKPAARPPGKRLTYADRQAVSLGHRLKKDLGLPSALVDLAALANLIDQVTDLPALRDVFVTAAKAPRVTGEVRAFARLCIARVDWRRGRRPRAMRWARTLGAVTKGLYIGPFPNEGGAGFDAVLPPEKAETAGQAPDLSKTLPGKTLPVRWRPLPAISPLGYVDLSALVSPPHKVVVYVRVVLRSLRDQAAYLRMGTPGPTKVWVNGKLVHQDKADHPPRFDQAAVAVLLHAGDNPVLLKLTQTQGELGYYLRITDRDGDRLRSIAVVPPATPGEAAPQEATAPPKEVGRHRPIPLLPPERVIDALAQAAKAHPKDPKALYDYAVVLGLERPFDRTNRKDLDEAKAAEAAANPKDKASARYPLLVARFETDSNRRRLALLRALAIDPNDVSALAQLGMHEYMQGFSDKAVDELRKAVKLAPDFLGAAISLAHAEAAAGFREDRDRRILSLLKRFPLAPRVLSEAASIDVQQGRLVAARDHLRVAESLYPADPGIRGSLTSVLIRLGDLDGVLGQLRDAVAFAPAALGPRLRFARFLSTNGHTKEAERVLDAAVAMAPDNAAPYVARAHHHLRHGDREAALTDVERAGKLTPQDTDVAALRRALTRQVADFASPWRVDLEKVAAAAKGHEPKDQDVWTLENLTVVRVHKSGLESRIVQQVAKALDSRGVDQLRSFSVAYTPGDQEVRILQARVLKKDGTVVEARSESEQSLSEPWYQMYYDRRARVVSFPDLAPGDVVEMSWRIDDVAAANMFGNYFGDMTYLVDTSPIRDEQYVLIGPAGRTFYFNDPKLPGLTHSVSKNHEGEQVLRWHATNVAPIVPEPGMPGWSEVAPYLHVSTYEHWGEVSSWWWGLIKDQLVPTPDLVTLAKTLVKGIPESDLKARVTAIYHYVVKQTRYVGLEFGIHGFKPYRVDQINQRRFGDCKDKASLMYALMRAVGIEADPVIVRTRDLGRLPKTPASLAVFNHAIAYVPALKLFLDGTAEFSGTDELPAMDRGATVLVVDPSDPGASKLGRIPQATAAMNHSSTNVDFTLAANGDATAKGRFSVEGTAAPSYRQSYQAKDKRTQLFEQAWGASFPGVKVVSLAMSGLEHLEKPVGADFDLKVPNFATGSGTSWTITPFGASKGYTERYAPLSSRHYPLLLGFPFTSRFHYAVTLPAGWTVKDLPAEAKADGPYGHFHLAYAKTKTGFTVDGEVALTAPRISVKAYPKFRAFLGDVDRAISRHVDLNAPAQSASRDASSASARR